MLQPPQNLGKPLSTALCFIGFPKPAYNFVNSHFLKLSSVFQFKHGIRFQDHDSYSNNHVSHHLCPSYSFVCMKKSTIMKKKYEISISVFLSAVCMSICIPISIMLMSVTCMDYLQIMSQLTMLPGGEQRNKGQRLDEKLLSFYSLVLLNTFHVYVFISQILCSFLFILIFQILFEGVQNVELGFSQG